MRKIRWTRSTAIFLLVVAGVLGTSTGVDAGIEASSTSIQADPNWDVAPAGSGSAAAVDGEHGMAAPADTRWE
ncbi:hypothetical protein [Streptomyces spongiicola]|uniref:hypothetical protein n=1 Tax=Streptomyces spongiicola TaxID=1690221 RepID=UPI0013A574C7|nr:hypothetical protein [Streptomyces spongiicola]